jgi:hypothetical protein
MTVGSSSLAMVCGTWYQTLKQFHTFRVASRLQMPVSSNRSIPAASLPTFSAAVLIASSSFRCTHRVTGRKLMQLALAKKTRDNVTIITVHL